MKVPSIQSDRNPPKAWAERCAGYNAEVRRGIHVTDLVNCPRKGALSIDGYMGVAASGNEATSWGSALHELVGAVEVPVALTLADVDITGSADKIEDGIVIDYKFPNTDSYYWIVKANAPKPEHVWQVEAYRLGLSQMGAETAGGRVQYGAHSSGKWPNWLGFEWRGPVQSEDAILAFSAFDSPYTVADILHMAAGNLSVDDIPLVGGTMKFGKEKTMCDYCEFAVPCRLRASVAPTKAAF